VRVFRSFAFVDVSGFTSLTEQEGDEAAVEILTSFRQTLRDICGRRGVRIAKWLGDGAMLVCVETQPLLCSILELHHIVPGLRAPIRAISIRSGITCGDVILMEGDDYVGHCVNVAARLCDLAQDGEALAAPSVLGDLPRWGAATGHRDISLRGVGRAIQTASLRLADCGPESFADPVCGLPLSPAIAEADARDALGQTSLFCSVSCLDTWRSRPART
jgi:adenylate cyclase